MNDITLIGILILYLVLVVILVIVGSRKKIGRWRIFLLSVFLTPFIGYLALIISKPISLIKLTRYRCPVCRLEFTEIMVECPFCSADGLKTRIQKVVMHTI